MLQYLLSHFYNIYLLSFVLAFCLVYIFIPFVIKLSILIGVVDTPDHRKVHKAPIPRLGGIAMYLGFMIVGVATLVMHQTIIGILLGATFIVITGIIDDVISMKPVVKLGCQIAIALLTYSFGIGIEFVTSPFGGVIYLGLFSLPITVFWIVGIVNVINLIDGLDGLAAGIVAISSTVISVVAISMGQIQVGIISIILVGVCVGFLKFNFSPAQIFMGDTGSMFLGYMLAVMTIIGVMKSTITMSLLIPLLVLGVPISDTVLAIVRRIKNKQHIMQADNLHIHHRLLNLGLTQEQVVILIYFASCFLGGVALIVFETQIFFPFFLGFFILFLAGLFFVYKRQKLKNHIHK